VVGRRDHAVLLVLRRLGLRAGEVAALRLDDVDWRAGQIVVHGKGRPGALSRGGPVTGVPVGQAARQTSWLSASSSARRRLR
jgi:integrase